MPPSHVLNLYGQPRRNAGFFVLLLLRHRRSLSSAKTRRETRRSVVLSPSDL